MPDYTRLGKDLARWSREIKESLRPAFCVHLVRHNTPSGDGVSLGGKGDSRDAGGNIAWSALYTFAKLADETTGLSPPGRILSNLEKPEYFTWCEAFVKLLDIENLIQEHRERVIEARTTKDWLDNTNQHYESTGLKDHYLASLIEADRATGFNTLPLSQASQDFHDNQLLTAFGEIEPSIKPKEAALSREGRISTKSSSVYANGCLASSLVTTEATKVASIAVVNLLKFTAEGVTCFRSKLASILVEAATALQVGWHSDFPTGIPQFAPQ